MRSLQVSLRLAKSYFLGASNRPDNCSLASPNNAAGVRPDLCKILCRRHIKYGPFMPRLAILLVSSLTAAGCVTDSTHRYDPNAIEKSGVVVAAEEIQNGMAFKEDTLSLPVAGVLVPIYLGSPQKEGNDFRYKVRTNDGQTIPVISKFGGFAVGECVTLFLSQTSPPGIANGGGCQ